MKYGSVEGQVAIEGKLIEYRGVNIAEHPAYEEIDATGYGRISVFTKVLLPPASKVNIRVIPDESKPEERMSFQGTDSSWMRMEERVSTKHLTLVIENAEAGAAKAGQVDVLVFLGKR